MNIPCHPAATSMRSAAPASSGSTATETHALEPEPWGLAMRIAAVGAERRQPLGPGQAEQALADAGDERLGQHRLRAVPRPGRRGELRGIGAHVRLALGKPAIAFGHRQ